MSRKLKVLLLGFAAVGLGCGGDLKTGKVNDPFNKKPAADGTCPSDKSLCGKGTFAICADLQIDPVNCGVCGRTCAPGIACEAGVCAQTVCTGATIPLSISSSSSPPGGSAMAAGVAASALLADIDGDGHLDLVDYTGGTGSDTFQVSLGRGDGFAGPDTYHSAFDIYSISATDVNGDGFDDLLVFSTAHPMTAPTRQEVWLGHADGHLTRFSASDVAGVQSGLAAIGDLSGDGWPDLVILSDYGQEHINVYLSDATGALHLSKAYDTGITYTIRINDWNGDGSPDLVLERWSGVVGSTLEILYNRGDGIFDPPVDCAVVFPFGATDGILADFNHDGHTDLAASMSRGVDGPSITASVEVILGLGGCGFSPITSYEIPGSRPAGRLNAADMDGDGQLDLIAISISDEPSPDPSAPQVSTWVTVLRGNPDGTFQSPGTAISLGPGYSGIAVGEATGDQRPDIIGINAAGQPTTVENNCQ